MRLGWMVQLQNSPTPRQARPARPKWPQPSLPAVPPSRCPAVSEGHPGLCRPAPRGRSTGRPASPLRPEGSRGRTPQTQGLRKASGGRLLCGPRGRARSASGARFTQTTSRTSVVGGAGRSQEPLAGAGPGNLWALVEALLDRCEVDRERVSQRTGAQRQGTPLREASARVNTVSSHWLRVLVWKGLGGSHSFHVIFKTLLIKY